MLQIDHAIAVSVVDIFQKILPPPLRGTPSQSHVCGIGSVRVRRNQKQMKMFADCEVKIANSSPFLLPKVWKDARRRTDVPGGEFNTFHYDEILLWFELQGKGNLQLFVKEPALKDAPIHLD